MKATASSDKTQQALKALLSMIDEPDERIYEQISDSVLNLGPAIIPILKREIDNTFDDFVRHRLQELTQEIRFRGSLHALQRWKISENHDLLQLLKNIARFHDPEMSHVAVENRLLTIKKDIWLELSNNLTSLESIRLINHILFTVKMLKPDNSTPLLPGNFFLNQFLVNKSVQPVAFGAFYLGICQRFTLPVFYVDLPDNFLLAFTNHPVSEIGKKTVEPLFYINPLMEGVVFNRSQIDKFLAQNKIDPNPKHFAPCTNLKVAKKLFGQLSSYYQAHGQKTRLRHVWQMMELIS